MNAEYMSRSKFNRPQLHPHRQLWSVTSSHLARSGELERMLSLERAESQRLRGAVAEDDHGDQMNEVKGISLEHLSFSIVATELCNIYRTHKVWILWIQAKPNSLIDYSINARNGVVC